MSDSVKSNEKINFWLGFFVGMAAIAIIGFVCMMIVVFHGQPPVNLATDNLAPSAVQPAAEPPVADKTVSDVPAVTKTDHQKGNAKAKVVVIEYTDFECPYCLKNHATIKQLTSDYGNKILYVMRNFPLSFHPNAQKAAEAAECAGEQGKFFEMADKIFAANEKQTMGVDQWKADAKALGLRTNNFNDCLDSGQMAQKISDSQAGGAAAGVDGTPATFINGQLVSGALPLESFKQIIDPLLK